MRLRVGIAIVASLAAVAVARGLQAGTGDQSPRHPMPVSKRGNLVVGLCDGETALEVKGVKEGGTLTRAQAQEVSDALMNEWRRKNPGAKWDDGPVQVAAASDAGGAGAPAGGAAATAPTDAPPSAAGARPGSEAPPAEKGGVQQGIYSGFTERDQVVWQSATDKFVADGKTIFHDTKLLGGTIGVSCDMCHPDAANTHPETYPKYQVQLGRVAMLRDMINWCIQNPVRGKPLPDDDVKLKALEAYVLAQRKGVPLDYGTH